MNCEQIIYLGIFAIVAIYLYQNVLGHPNSIHPVGPIGERPPSIDPIGPIRHPNNTQPLIEGFDPGEGNGPPNPDVPPSNAETPGSEVRASEKLGNNEMSAPVQFNRTPSSCYPQESLTAKDLLPNDESANITEFNQNYPIGQGILNGINFLSSGYSIGVNTVGQSLKNANRQLRSEPPNPQVSVSPWMNSSIGPDLLRRPLEVGDSCGASA